MGVAGLFGSQRARLALAPVVHVLKRDWARFLALLSRLGGVGGECNTAGSADDASGDRPGGGTSGGLLYCYQRILLYAPSTPPRPQHQAPIQIQTITPPPARGG